MKKKRLTVVALHLRACLRKAHKDLLQLWASLLQSPAKASLPHLPAFYIINPAQHILRHQCSLHQQPPRQSSLKTTTLNNITYPLNLTHTLEY